MPDIPATNDNMDAPRWGLQRNITPCFGARLVQEGYALRKRADLRGRQPRFARVRLYRNLSDTSHNCIRLWGCTVFVLHL